MIYQKIIRNVTNLKQMFTKFEHVYNAITVRLRRKLLKMEKKPDISQITNQIFVGGVSEIKLLFDAGIDSVLDLRMESSDDEKELEKYSMKYLRIRVSNRKIPNIIEAKKALKWINDVIKNRGIIFIHCNLGRGRGPLFACLYLINQGFTVEEAIKKVKDVRKYTYFNSHQLKFLCDFFNENQ